MTDRSSRAPGRAKAPARPSTAQSGPKQRSRARSAEEREARLQAILDAALDVFGQKGFAETRLEDVAARAGIGKGTIYLYVSSKQALFEALVRSGIAAPIEKLEARIMALDRPVEEMLRLLLTFLRTEVLATRRIEIVRLLIAEAGRLRGSGIVLEALPGASRHGASIGASHPSGGGCWPGGAPLARFAP